MAADRSGTSQLGPLGPGHWGASLSEQRASKNGSDGSSAASAGSVGAASRLCLWIRDIRQ